jgi:signal transduction histidine kinase
MDPSPPLGEAAGAAAGGAAVGGARSLRTVATVLRSMRAGQLVIAVVLVVVGAVRAIADGTAPGLAIAMALVFAGWYFGGLLLAARTRAPHLGAGWLVGLGLIWVGAVAASAEFVWLAFSLWLLAGYILRMRWAIAYSVVVLAVVVIAPLWHHGTTSYANVIGPLVGGIFAFGIARGYIELVREARERQQLVDSLIQAQREMAELQDELARTQRESGAIAERTRLSRDIHDTIAQGLSSIGMLARASLDDERPYDCARVLEQIESLARASLTDVRRIVAALMPAELEEGALPGALRRMLDQLAAESDIEVELHVDDDLPALPTAAEVALLRTAQSALANVRLHSDARRVVISLADAGDSVRLDVVDDGHGFDLAAWDRAGLAGLAPGASGYGLRSMRARLRELGGGLDVESAPGDGTALSAHVPLIRDASATRAGGGS